MFFKRINHIESVSVFFFYNVALSVLPVCTLVFKLNFKYVPKAHLLLFELENLSRQTMSSKFLIF